MKVICHWSDSRESREFVTSRGWLAVHFDGDLFTFHRGNTVRVAEIAPFGKVVIKESRITDQYSKFEKFGREMRLRIFNTDLRDAKSALMAESLGVATYHPFAVWETREHGCTASFIMYSFVEGRLLNDLCKGGKFEENDRGEVEKYLTELGKMARKLHDGGLRHRDLHPQNIIVRPDNTLSLIDFASGYRVPVGSAKMHAVGNFASLRRLGRLFDASALTAFCRGYCEGRSEAEFEYALAMMLYWKHNGLKGTGGLHILGFFFDEFVAWRLRWK